VRVVVGPSGRLTIDRTAPGRGAWLCRMGSTELAQARCVAEAGRRGAFARSLRADIGAGDVALLLATAYEHARMGQTDGGAGKASAIADDERD
jgi:predicted RNA-binding protein YlxR (DUF448 family)